MFLRDAEAGQSGGKSDWQSLRSREGPEMTEHHESLSIGRVGIGLGGIFCFGVLELG